MFEVVVFELRVMSSFYKLTYKKKKKNKLLLSIIKKLQNKIYTYIMHYLLDRNIVTN